jgi:hypothetical protein
VACRPELLPDEDEWCKKLHAGVRRAGKGARFRRLVKKFLKADQHDGTNVLETNQQDGRKVPEADEQDGTSWVFWKQISRMAVMFWNQSVMALMWSRMERNLHKNWCSKTLDGSSWQIFGRRWSCTLLRRRTWMATPRPSLMVALLWALLAHAGIIDKAGFDDAAIGTNNNRSAADDPNAAADHHI